MRLLSTPTPSRWAPKAADVRSPTSGPLSRRRGRVFRLPWTCRREGTSGSIPERDESSGRHDHGGTDQPPGPRAGRRVPPCGARSRPEGTSSTWAASRSADGSSWSSPGRAPSRPPSRCTTPPTPWRPPAPACSAAARSSRGPRRTRSRASANPGLRLLADAGRSARLPTVTEVLAPEDVPMVAGTPTRCRSVRATSELRPAQGAWTGRSSPVLLKRGMSTTIAELLLAAEYLLAHGNPDVILCERGIRSFDSSTRNTLDLAAVPVLAALTHLPVVIDPSHGTGRRRPRRSAREGRCRRRRRRLDHRGPSRPRRAWSDGAQSLDPARSPTHA